MRTGRQPEEEAAIHLTARLIVGGHSESAEAMIDALLMRAASCPMRSGVTARRHWIAVMQALGETFLTIARLERTRQPGI